MMDCPPTEHGFIASFDATTSGRLPRVHELAGPRGQQLATSLFDALPLVVIADMRFREAERLEGLGLDRSRAAAAREGARRYNTASLEVLTQQVLPAIEEIRTEFGEATIDPRPLRVFDMEAREQLAKSDLNGRRAAIARRLLSDAVTAGTDSGIGGLCDRLQHDGGQLIELCREREEHNNPIGLVVGGLVALAGIVIIGICNIQALPNSCSDPQALLWGGMFIAVGGLIIAVTSGASSETPEDGPIGEDDPGPL
jgi:hypothetical protein